MLTIIDSQLGIQMLLQYPSGRETLATEFIRHGGTVQVLPKLLGHSKITTTMKYVHVNEHMIVQDIEQLDACNKAA